MQESRLFRIIYYLMDKGQATAPELAKELEVSVRTIYRDVDSLSSAGIPIYVTTGRTGGIHLLENYVLDKALFSASEKQEILSGLQSLLAVQYPNTDQMIEKLSAIFQMKAPSWLEVDFSRWGCIAEKENQLFHQLRQAILERRMIMFYYYVASGGSGEYRVLPQKLIYKDKAWYLYAFHTDHKENKLFRLTRIKKVALTEIHFERPLTDKQTVLQKSQSIGKNIELELWFPTNVVARLLDQFDDSDIFEQDNGYILRATLPENEWLYSFLMSFGDKVTILKPLYLKERLADRYKAALKHITEYEE